MWECVVCEKKTAAVRCSVVDLHPVILWSVVKLENVKRHCHSGMDYGLPVDYLDQQLPFVTRLMEVQTGPDP